MFFDRITETESPSVIKAYEKKIAELEKEKILMTEKIATCGTQTLAFDEMFQTAFDFIENPQKY